MFFEVFKSIILLCWLFLWWGAVVRGALFDLGGIGGFRHWFTIKREPFRFILCHIVVDYCILLQLFASILYRIK